MRSTKEQIEGLRKVAALVGRYECNCAVIDNGGAVVYLEACDVFCASQIVFASSGYDIWGWRLGRLELQKEDVTAKEAAHKVASEYLGAKVKRIKKHSPHLGMSDIVDTLIGGYQSTKHN